MDKRPTPAETPKAVTRRYSDREIALILTRTAELQATRAAESEVTQGLTQGELEQIAREAGLDPRFIHTAIAELDSGKGTPQSRWLGGSTWLQLERSVDGEVPVAEYEALVEIIHRTLGEVGQPSVLGRTLRWHALTGVGGQHAHGREIEVAIAARNGVTTIRVHEKLRALATQIFAAGIAGGGSTVGMLTAIGGGALLGPVGVVGGLVLGLGAAYAAARGLFANRSQKRSAQLRALVDRLAEHIAGTAVAVPGGAVVSELERRRRTGELASGDP
jgi:hypothetical protein